MVQSPDVSIVHWTSDGAHTAELTRHGFITRAHGPLQISGVYVTSISPALSSIKLFFLLQLKIASAQP